MSLSPGTQLGSYEIVSLIGAGGMGEVYRARDVRIGRDVAVKVLPDDLVANHDRLARFQREAQSAGSLNHPNLLTIHELGSDDGRSFIVSELLDGVTLRERLQGGAFAPRRPIEYATQIAAGLAAAHERGIVHRDLKPENIFITRDGRLKILDFGLAKVTASIPNAASDTKTAAKQDGATDPGAVVGTAGYMSPAKRLTKLYASTETLAWAGDASIWFAASAEGNSASLYRVSEGTEPVLVLSSPGTMFIQAVARDGRVLVSQSDVRMRLMTGKIGEAAEHELSWLDWSLVRDITPDGKMVLFDESGEGGGSTYSVFVRPTDGGPAVRLGDGLAAAFSPDQKAVLAIRQGMNPPQIFIYPTGAGETRQVTHDGMRHLYAGWTPDGKSIVFRASDASHASTLFLQDLAGGAPRALSPPGVSQSSYCSPDGQWVTVRGPDSVQTLYPLRGGSAMPLTGLDPTFTFAGWTADSKQIYFVSRNVVPAPLVRYDLATRTSTKLKELTLSEPSSGVNNLRVARDGVTYAYSYIASRSDLYLIEGLNASRR